MWSLLLFAIYRDELHASDASWSTNIRAQYSLQRGARERTKYRIRTARVHKKGAWCGMGTMALGEVKRSALMDGASMAGAVAGTRRRRDVAAQPRC